MIRLLISIFLSILIHICFLSYIKTDNNIKEKTPKKTQVIYIKKKNKILLENKKSPKIPSNIINKKLDKKVTSIPKNLNKPIIKKNIRNIEKKIIKKENKVIEESKQLTKEEIEIQKKIEVLRKNPYFKNWSDDRIKKLELPPGMKDWSEVEKMTQYLDTQYNWTYTPPNLGDENKNSWKEFNINNNFQIRFLFEKVVFIAEFQEEKNIVFITYFNKNDQVNENFDLPKDIKDENINFFEIEITKKIINNERNIIINEYINQIIEYYKNIKSEEKMN